ncbi:lamin tail domain-containing protein [Joostella sp. CR20]
MRISRRFENANEQIPQGNGKIIGVLQYDENYQIGIRNVDDVSQMVNEPCNVLESATEIALEMLLLQHGNSSEAITENLKITATVTSDYATRNIDSQRMIVQNGNIGVELQLETALEIPIYSEVEIALRGVSIEQTEFGFSFSGITENHILNVVAGEEILPKTISIDELFSEENQYKVIQLNNVQFENTANTFSGENILTNCEMQFPLSVLETATFVNTTVAEGNGTLVGIPYQNRLYVQNLSAFQFTNTYEDCSLQYTSDAIFISEIADPDNNSTAVNMRFIEIYNSSSEAVNLDGWVLRRYTNTNVEFTERSVIDLSGYEILPNATFVIAADAVSFEATYGFTPHLDGGTGGAADSNGDDNIELVDGNGMVVDIFGVVGEDGSGTNHEFEDGRAVRKTSVVKNNSSYTFSEWIIYNDTGDSGTFKEPKTAPQDYTPGVR